MPFSLHALQACIQAAKTCQLGRFNMRIFTWPDGHPACLLAHLPGAVKDGQYHSPPREWLGEFTAQEWTLVFGPEGCARARTPREAITYLEKVIANRGVPPELVTWEREITPVS